MRMLRLVVATEHTLFRAGLRCLLESVDGVKVVADTGSGRELIALSKSHRPSVVLIEPDLSEVGGLEAIGQIRALSPESTVILMAPNGVDSKLESRAMEVGAAGVLSKGSSVRDLERLLRSVREGRAGSDEAADGARIRRPRTSRGSRGSS